MILAAKRFSQMSSLLLLYLHNFIYYISSHCASFTFFQEDTPVYLRLRQLTTLLPSDFTFYRLRCPARGGRTGSTIVECVRTQSLSLFKCLRQDRSQGYRSLRTCVEDGVADRGRLRKESTTEIWAKLVCATAASERTLQF